MIGQPKNHYHIWDNVYENFSVPNIRTVRASKICHDTTGTTVSIYEYHNRKVVSDTLEEKVIHRNEESKLSKLCLQKKPNSEKKYENLQKDNQAKRTFVTNSDRHKATPPRNLNAWQYVSERAKENYDRKAASEAFAEYARKMKEQKMEKERNKNGEARFDCRTGCLKMVSKNCEPSGKCEKIDVKYRCEKSVEVRNRRDDDVKIDTFCYKSGQQKVKNGNGVPPPAFYGTIEAEQSANNVAEHIHLACNHLKRLQFLSSEVFPKTKQQLAILNKIGHEVKDFNSQLKANRARVPKNMNANSQNVAHFVIDDEHVDGYSY